MGNDDTARKAAIRLIARGLITPAQAAELAGVSRQLVRYWLLERGIDWHKNYDARLAKLWFNEVNRRK